MFVTLISQGAAGMTLKGLAVVAVGATGAFTGEQLCRLYDFLADRYVSSPEPDHVLPVSVYDDPSRRPVPAGMYI